MKIAELKSWLKDCADDAEIRLFITDAEDDTAHTMDINTMIIMEKDKVKKYYLHGESK